MNLRTAQARFSLNLAVQADLREMAVEALVSGSDTPSLRRLAGAAVNEDSEVLRNLFYNAIDEMGFNVLSKCEARRIVASDIANDIVSKRISPYDGARQIWGELCIHRERATPPDPLNIFVALASEWEDFPDRQADYANEILREAQELLHPKAEKAEKGEENGTLNNNIGPTGK